MKKRARLSRGRSRGGPPPLPPPPRRGANMRAKALSGTLSSVECLVTYTWPPTFSSTTSGKEAPPPPSAAADPTSLMGRMGAAPPLSFSAMPAPRPTRRSRPAHSPAARAALPAGRPPEPARSPASQPHPPAQGAPTGSRARSATWPPFARRAFPVVRQAGLGGASAAAAPRRPHRFPPRRGATDSGSPVA
uniref:Uncharacterized protein n=1 Tax=Sphaerodactylus townsendi TaxID=933632 RepID=A0ACB8E764_9SAUR